MFEYRYMEFLKDLYDLRYSLTRMVSDCEYLSALCVNTHDAVGTYFYDGKVNAYQEALKSLSALLDKAESGR